MYETTNEEYITEFANKLAEGKKPEIQKYSVIVMKNGAELECNWDIETLCKTLK